jgi:predicted ArsR family transcriptional regulator
MNGDGSSHDPVAAVALLDEPTRRRLYDFVVASDSSITRDQAAAALGISRELAAFHLDRLLSAGLLEVEFRRLGDRRGPGGGRPAKLYRRSEREVAVSFPGRRYERLAGDFAEALDHLDGSSAIEAVDRVARTRGEADGKEIRRSVGPRPSRHKLEDALVEHLRGAGYEPRVDPQGEGIRLGNCPYHALSASHRELTCGMNLAWAEGVVAGLGVRNLDVSPAPEPGQCCVRFERQH